MRFRRISTPLIGGMGALLVCVLGTSSAISYIQLEQASLDAAQESANSAIRAFHRGLLQELPPHDQDLAVYLDVSASTAGPVAFADIRRDREEMKRLFFVSATGKMVSAEGDHPAAPALRAAWGELIARGQLASIRDDHELVVFVPLQRDQTRLGGTIVVYDDARLVAAQRAILWRSLSLFVGMMLIGAALALVLLRQITRPLQAISAAIGRLTAGDLEAEVPLVDRGDELGTVAYGLASMRDEVRERIRQLADREAEQRSILRSLHEGVVALDAEGAIIAINPAATELLGGAPATLLGAHFATLPVGLEPVSRPHLAEGEAFEIGDRLVQIARVPLLGGRDGGQVCVLRDITREEALAELLSHTQKMDAIGRLAGGVAHDFNNLLTGMLGAAELAQLKVGPSSDVQAELAIIIQAAEHAATLNGRLLAFSRKGAHSRATVDMHDVIQDTLTLFSRGAPKDIDVELRTRAQHSMVWVDITELQSALLNLCVNAADAMADGGTLRLETWDAEGERLGVRVSDTGVGIPPEIRERMFEPYFTTKEEGKGTGLGLAAVYGTIEAHQGEIEVQSEVGVGTTFTILLPRLRAGRSAGPRPSAQAPGRVLVIDDDAMVRELAHSGLSTQGFEVLTAGGGVEGLELFAAHRGHLQAVVLDWIMPDVSGAEVLKRIVSVDPQQIVIVSSGFTGGLDEASLRAAGAAALVRKPYGPLEMAKTILDRAASAPARAGSADPVDG